MKRDGRAVELYSDFRYKARKLLEENSVKYIDLNSQDFSGLFADGDFLDEMHLNREANGRLAEIIAKALTQGNLL